MLAGANTITELTREYLFEDLASVKWAGRLSEVEFLSRLFDLAKMRSNGARVPSAAQDIEMHRVTFPGDWPDNWIFRDDRFNLMRCDDTVLLRFLCEMVHPMVRREAEEVQKLVTLFNSHLAPDGWELRPSGVMSSRPIFEPAQLPASNGRLRRTRPADFPSALATSPSFRQ